MVRPYVILIALIPQTQIHLINESVNLARTP